MSNQPFLQSSLGEVSKNKTRVDRVWDAGTLSLGVVTKVHVKRYTADVKMLGSSDQISSPHSQEGRYACRIGVSMAGYDEEFKKPYGSIVPIQKGSIVLVGFINNSKDKPVILRVFHDISEEVAQNNYKNILESMYSDDGTGEVSKNICITPVQDFMSLDRMGNLEIASHSKSFFVAKTQEMSIDEFDFEDLSVKTPDGNTITNDMKYSTPLKVMSVFRDSFVDSVTNWLKIFVDASRTSFQLAKIHQKDNKSTILEIDEGGTVSVRRQLDTRITSDSKENTEISIDKDGVAKIQANSSKGSTFLKVDRDGSVTISVKDGKTVLNVTESGVTINSSNVSISKLNVDNLYIGGTNWRDYFD